MTTSLLKFKDFLHHLSEITFICCAENNQCLLGESESSRQEIFLEVAGHDGTVYGWSDSGKYFEPIYVVVDAMNITSMCTNNSYKNDNCSFQICRASLSVSQQKERMTSMCIRL